MAALREHVRVTGAGVVLSESGFADAVLADLPREERAGLEPMALWWGAGGPPPELVREGDWVWIGRRWMGLRSWSWRERCDALNASVSQDGGGQQFDFVGYLDTMVRACIVDSEPTDLVLEEIDAAETAALLAAVRGLNEPDQTLANGTVSGDLARKTLQLCKALGWTPSQVWAAPAAEIDALLGLLEIEERPAPVAKTASVRGSRLARHADAVVIQIGDDP